MTEILVAGGIVLLIISIVGGIWLVPKQGFSSKIYAWIYRPEKDHVLSEVTEQLAAIKKGTDEVLLSISSISLERPAGQPNGDWRGTIHAELTAPRFVLADWSKEAEKSGFDQASYSKAVETASQLPSLQSLEKPSQQEVPLVREVAPKGKAIEIRVTGRLELKGKVWKVTITSPNEVQEKLTELMQGQPLPLLGENALPLDSPEAAKVLATFTAQSREYIKAVETAEKVAQEEKRQKDEMLAREKERQRMEQKATDDLAAPGLVQACWYALEKLAKYFTNAGINQRLINLSQSQGDSRKIALYRSYAQTNETNIQDAISSYQKGIKDLSRLGPASRQQALRELKEEIEGHNSPWKNALINQMIKDTEDLPDFQSGSWQNRVRQIRKSP